MKKALISPNETIVRCISGWTTDVPPKPIFSDIANACRVAQIEEEPFEVAPPLYWIECADTVNSSEFYFDTVDNIIKPIVNAPIPQEQ